MNSHIKSGSGLGVLLGLFGLAVTLSCGALPSPEDLGPGFSGETLTEISPLASPLDPASPIATPVEAPSGPEALGLEDGFRVRGADLWRRLPAVLAVGGFLLPFVGFLILLLVLTITVGFWRRRRRSKPAKESREPAATSAAPQQTRSRSSDSLPGEPASPHSLIVGRATDVGSVRSLNEDSLRTLDLAPAFRLRHVAAGLFLVADGMGGHEAGDVASALASQAVVEMATHELLEQDPSEQTSFKPDEWLSAALKQANQAVYDARRSTGSDMGTTLVAALIVDRMATVANVGDSRCYLLGSEGLDQITVDHSLVARLVATGQITREEAAHHPQRNVIYRAIGDRPQVEVDIFEQELQPGEALLLCSDGLSGMVSDERLWELWQAAGSPQEACEHMVAAANRAGGEDNITVVIVQASA